MTPRHAQNPVPPGTAALARLLEACPGPAGTLLESIASGPVSAEVFATAPCLLTDSERLLLQPSAADTAARGTGLLRTHRGIPVADVTIVLLPARRPRRHEDDIPWARLLHEDPAVLQGCHRSVTRIRTGRGYLDAAGHEQPVRSTALLENPGTGPVMLAVSGFYAEFAALAARYADAN